METDCITSKIKPRIHKENGLWYIKNLGAVNIFLWAQAVLWVAPRNDAVRFKRMELKKMLRDLSNVL